VGLKIQDGYTENAHTKDREKIGRSDPRNVYEHKREHVLPHARISALLYESKENQGIAVISVKREREGEERTCEDKRE